MSEEPKGIVGFVGDTVMPRSRFQVQATVPVPNVPPADIFQLLIAKYPDSQSRFEGETLVVNSLAPPSYKGILDWWIFVGLLQGFINGMKWYSRWDASFRVAPSNPHARITADVTQRWVLSTFSVFVPMGWAYLLIALLRVRRRGNPFVRNAVQSALNDVCNTLNKRATLERLSGK